jgi:hypothetical protein
MPTPVALLKLGLKIIPSRPFLTVGQSLVGVDAQVEKGLAEEVADEHGREEN